LNQKVSFNGRDFIKELDEDIVTNRVIRVYRHIMQQHRSS
jgi:hypothetical protein